MRITAINGSPKLKDSNSERYVETVVDLLDHNMKIKMFPTAKSLISQEALLEVIHSDVLLLAFPLYVDGIPVNMLKQLIALEQEYRKTSHADTIIYVIVNNGFYEGEQNANAIAMIQNFCKRAGVQFGQGIGIGTGEMNANMMRSGMQVGQGILKNLGDALKIFAKNIAQRQSAASLYVSPNLSWKEFHDSCNDTYWNERAIDNGVSLNDLERRLEYKRG